jgi:hypothetical protein
MFPRLAKTFAIVGSVATLVETTTVFGAFAEPGFGGVWLPDVNDQKREETANIPRRYSKL